MRGRGRGRGFRGRGRGRGFRGRGQFVNTRGGAAAPAKKKLAIGRNVFCESDEEEEEETLHEEVADFKPRSKGFVKERKAFHPHESQQGFSKAKPKENNRWKRWQELSRKTGDEDDVDDIAKFPSPENSPEREINPSEGKEESQRPTSRLSNVSSTASFSQQQLPQETPTQQQHHKGITVTVKTFENEEVGILAGGKNLVILFNINQVWIRHPSVGYCNFRENYPKSDLSKLLFPGKSVLCWARNVPSTREVTYQATVVWLESEAPSESIYRTAGLVQELNFHLAEYSSGRLSSLDTVNATPTKLKSVEGVIQEWISNEVRLT